MDNLKEYSKDEIIKMLEEKKIKAKDLTDSAKK